MASIIKAGNATDGVQVSSDATGALDIKTGTGAGTTAISIDASQNVAIPGTLTVGGFPAGGNYALESYVAPATWTKPAGLKAIKVTVVGAGGNGGTISSGTGAAAGGGGGGAAIEYIPAPSIPGPVAVTAGPGTNSFGGFCSATSGSNAPSTVSELGGAGGSGSGGDIDVAGMNGNYGASLNISPTATARFSGFGGSSILGAGGNGLFVIPSINVTGIPGKNYGGGGSGTVRMAPGTGTGGAGAPGIVIVEEFY
jgi:hypothetical protein